MSDSRPSLPVVSRQPDTDIVEFPVYYVRGGTSTGLIIDDAIAPADIALREELLRHLMGVPLTGTQKGNTQTTGLGRGPATSNKVFFVSTETVDGQVRLVSTLAQLASQHASIDWSVNCGNMSSALPLWALAQGLAADDGGNFEIDIRNTNTGVISTARVLRDEVGRLVNAEIPGVAGAFPAVDLFLHHPVGSKTGKLLPTGMATDLINGVDVSCVDAAVPMVILDAAQLGKTAYEAPRDLEADAAFMARIRDIWSEAGLRMQLRRVDGELMTREDLAASETMPKVCIIGKAAQGGNLSVRYFTPQTAHASMAVSGACCLAVASLIPGTVAHRIATNVAQPGSDFGESTVVIENPAGLLEATAVAKYDGTDLVVSKVGYRRNAQLLMRGSVPLYRASEALREALLNGTCLAS